MLQGKACFNVQFSSCLFYSPFHHTKLLAAESRCWEADCIMWKGLKLVKCMFPICRNHHYKPLVYNHKFSLLKLVPKKKVLHFPRKSKKDYIKVTTSFNTSLTAFTISLMMQVETSYSQKDSSPFSLATTASMNSLLIYVKPDKVSLHVPKENQ